MFIPPINSDYPVKQESSPQITPKDPRIESIAADLNPGGENSYLQAYPKDVAFRIKARENFLLPPYKMGFRNLVTLIVSPDMPIDEAELLLHDIAVMTPEQRKMAFDLFSGSLSSVITQDSFHDLLQGILSNSQPSEMAIRIKSWLSLAKNALMPALNKLFLSSGEQPDSAKATVCPFQRLWRLPSLSQDPLVVKEVLKLHRFDKNVFKKGESSPLLKGNFLLDKTVIECEPEDTPRFRKIFTDLLLKKKAEERLMLIIQDHFDLLFEQKGIPSNEEDLEESLKQISVCILDEIPITSWHASAGFNFIHLDEKKLLESQLYIDLLNTGYTNEEIRENLRQVAFGTVMMGFLFLPRLLEDVHKPKAQDLLIRIRQNIQNELDNGFNIWEAIKKTKEIDMLILESLRMSNIPGAPRDALDGKLINVSLKSLAERSDLVGEKPEEFNPARLGEESGRPINPIWPSAVPWMPFGHGKHQCPGWRLYQIMSRYLLAKYALAT